MVGLQFVGSKKEKASKADRLCVSLFKKFAKQNGCKSDEEVNEEEVRNEGDDANTTTEAATSGAEDSVTGNSNMDLEVMEVEYNADVDLDPAIDDVGLNDVYGRVGLGGVFQDDLSVGGAAHGGSEGAVADVPHTGIAGAETDGGIAGREEVAGVQEGPPSLVAGEGIASTVSGDGVAYVVDNQIRAVGNVDHTRKVLHGHQISSGYVCVSVVRAVPNRTGTFGFGRQRGELFSQERNVLRLSCLQAFQVGEACSRGQSCPSKICSVKLIALFVFYKDSFLFFMAEADCCNISADFMLKICV